MKGIIISEGQIRAEDGAVWPFSADSVRSGQPAVGSQVDFLIADGKAIEIYVLGQAAEQASVFPNPAPQPNPTPTPNPAQQYVPYGMDPEEFTPMGMMRRQKINSARTIGIVAAVLFLISWLSPITVVLSIISPFVWLAAAICMEVFYTKIGRLAGGMTSFLGNGSYICYYLGIVLLIVGTITAGAGVASITRASGPEDLIRLFQTTGILVIISALCFVLAILFNCLVDFALANACFSGLFRASGILKAISLICVIIGLAMIFVSGSRDTGAAVLAGSLILAVICYIIAFILKFIGICLIKNVKKRAA